MKTLTNMKDVPITDSLGKPIQIRDYSNKTHLANITATSLIKIQDKETVGGEFNTIGRISLNETHSKIKMTTITSSEW